MPGTGALPLPPIQCPAALETARLGTGAAQVLTRVRACTAGYGAANPGLGWARLAGRAGNSSLKSESLSDATDSPSPSLDAFKVLSNQSFHFE